MELRHQAHNHVPCRGTFLVGALLAMALLSTSGAARAAPMLSVSFEVAGGSFNGPWSSGAVTSGAFSFTPTTPTSAPFIGPGVWNVSLLGASGSFQAAFSAVARVYSYGMAPLYPAFYGIGQVIGAVKTNGIEYTDFPNGVRFNIDGSVLAWNIGALVDAPGPCPDCSVTLFVHDFTVGNELRTFVPEPDTGALVGLGLVLIGFVGASRGAAPRNRRGLEVGNRYDLRGS